MENFKFEIEHLLESNFEKKKATDLPTLSILPKEKGSTRFNLVK